MKIEDLKKIVSKLNKVVENKNTLPELDYVKIHNQKFTVSNLKIFYSIKCFDLPAEISCLVDFKSFKKIISKLDKKYSADFALDGEVLFLKTSKGSFKLTINPIDNYPQEEEIENKFDRGFIGYGSILSIKKAINYVAQDDLLCPVENGIYLDSDNGYIVATDFHKLCYFKKDETDSFGNNSIIPAKVANILDENYIYSIKTDSKNIIFESSNDETISVRKIEGKYKQWQTVIPHNNDNILKVKSKELLEQLDLALISANSESLGVFDLKNEKSLLLSQDIYFGQSYCGDMKSKYVGKEMRVGFKIPFMQTIVKTEKVDDLTITFSDPTRAILINNCCVIMPLEI